jgi:hypothetical protein
MPIPLWLILFVAAGFLLFFLKISGDRPNPSGQPNSARLRLFLFLAFLLFAVASIADFVKWVRGTE